jgi:hypothetical protein
MGLPVGKIKLGSEIQSSLLAIRHATEERLLFGPVPMSTNGTNAKWRPVRRCLLFWVDRTYRRHHETDAFDPSGTWPDGGHTGVREPGACSEADETRAKPRGEW